MLCVKWRRPQRRKATRVNGSFDKKHKESMMWPCQNTKYQRSQTDMKFINLVTDRVSMSLGIAYKIFFFLVFLFNNGDRSCILIFVQSFKKEWPIHHLTSSGGQNSRGSDGSGIHDFWA